MSCTGRCWLTGKTELIPHWAVMCGNDYLCKSSCFFHQHIEGFFQVLLINGPQYIIQHRNSVLLASPRSANARKIHNPRVSRVGVAVVRLGLYVLLPAKCNTINQRASLAFIQLQLDLSHTFLWVDLLVKIIYLLGDIGQDAFHIAFAFGLDNIDCLLQAIAE